MVNHHFPHSNSHVGDFWSACPLDTRRPSGPKIECITCISWIIVAHVMGEIARNWGHTPFQKNTSIWSHGHESTQLITIPMNTFPFGDENPEIPDVPLTRNQSLSHALQGTLWRCRVGGGWCGRATHWWHLTSVSLSRLRMATLRRSHVPPPSELWPSVSCFCWTRQLDIVDI